MKWDEFCSERQRRGKPFVVAHRGVMQSAPENTLRGFELALEQGAFALETDLHFTKDDQIVLHHDATLDRMTNGTGYVRDYTLAELKELQIICPKTGQLSDVTIPTLTELIELTDANVPFVLELKDPLFQDRLYARRLIDLLSQWGVLEMCAIVSFQLAHVETVEKLCPPIPTGLITLKKVFPKRNTKLLGPAWPLLYANPFYVSWAHRWNSVVCPLDPTSEKRMDYYQWLGVDAVLADNPAAAIAAMD